MSGFAYLIFVIGVLLAWAFGAVGAYFYFRTRHREAIADLNALNRELDEREEELHRLQYQFTKANPDGPSSAQLAELKKTQEELEQKRNDYNILKQDFDLEIGILKQELEQLRSDETNVEHTKRRIARKNSELKERESQLIEKEKDVAGRAKRLDADIAARKQHLDDEFTERLKRLEEGLHERDEELRGRFAALQTEREALTRDRTSLRKKQEQLDKELLELPVHRFTSRQEALLIKRLRQQIKLQRDELEQLQRLVHRATIEAAHDDSFPTYSTLSSYVQHDRYASTEKSRDEPSSIFHDADALMQPHDDPSPRQPNSATHGREGEQARTALSIPAETAGIQHDPPDAPHERPMGATPPSGTGSIGRDDLTSLPGMNPEIQERLYRLDITSFDQIARWSSSDVRRVSEQLGIDRKIIQDHWIINAQSHLFSRKGD